MSSKQKSVDDDLNDAPGKESKGGAEGRATLLKWEPEDVSRLERIEEALRKKLGVKVSRVMAVRIAIANYESSLYGTPAPSGQ